jgi:hypothetical protein
MTRTLLPLLLACIGAGGVAKAQQDLTLRFSVTPGQVVHRLFQVHTRIAALEEGAAAATRETALLGSMREMAVAGPRGENVLHVTLDSLVARRRQPPKEWEETRIAGIDTLWLQIALDARLGVLRRVGSADTIAGALVQHLVTGFPGLRLPEGPVRSGTQWDQALELPVAEVTAGATPGPGTAVLPVRAAVVIDSLVASSRDTLAYLTLHGTVPATRVTGGNGVTVTYTGDVAGTLLWSSGWRLFVSGASRTSIAADVRGPEGAARFTIETTVRQAVAPEP